MNISPDFLAELAVMNLNYNKICDLFGLSHEDRRSPQAGDWIIDWIKQMQTAYLLRKAAVTNMPRDEKKPSPITRELVTEDSTPE